MTTTSDALELIVTDRSGAVRTIQGKDGLTVMAAIRDNGAAEDPFAECGGNCSCATCHVYIDPAFAEALPPASAEESALLDSSDHRKETSRLSCQLTFQKELNGLRVQIAPAD